MTKIESTNVQMSKQRFRTFLFALVSKHSPQQYCAPDEQHEIGRPYRIGRQGSVFAPPQPKHQQRIVDYENRQETKEETRQEIRVLPADGHHGPDPCEAKTTEAVGPSARRLGLPSMQAFINILQVLVVDAPLGTRHR